MQQDKPAAEETLPDLIAQLVPPPAPDTISLWPQTPLAKGLLLFLLLLLLLLAWYALKRYRANAYRRAALKALAQSGDDPAIIAEIVRRTALATFPRQQVAALTGNDWLDFLNRHCAGANFSGEPGHQLVHGAYRADQPPSPELARLAAHWIRRHRAGNRVLREPAREQQSTHGATTP
ncbi:DUF4381 domain-containing protein [uncultured Microbulbifer sp.]|uniref:DUF4381 domain-containing protein n=1 Tax=uncultured Microbulbifer sp. TaxID=348147 RepID=UPI0025DEDBEF|nr:DUF4381 domain-containing protein [uncultured Microbulbifer sp.]